MKSKIINIFCWVTWLKDVVMGKGHCDVQIPGSGAYNDGEDQKGGPVLRKEFRIGYVKCEGLWDVQGWPWSLWIFGSETQKQRFCWKQRLRIIILEWLMSCSKWNCPRGPCIEKWSPNPSDLRDRKESEIHKCDPSVCGEKVLAQLKLRNAKIEWIVIIWDPFPPNPKFFSRPIPVPYPTWPSVMAMLRSGSECTTLLLFMGKGELHKDMMIHFYSQI